MIVETYTRHGRKATIVQEDDGYVVDCYIGDTLSKTIDVKQYSLRYAEDTAENWVTSIISE